MTLRRRLLLTLIPALLVALLGAVGIALMNRVSHRIDTILTENYDSVVFMVALNEALERIDSSFNFAMLGEEKRALDQYQKNGKKYEENLEKEKNNVTLEGEQDLVDRLVELTTRYRRDGDRFY